jgi:hypothetical protein
MTKSLNRKLVSQEEFKSVIERLDILGKMVNGYINSIGNIQEPLSAYIPEINNPADYTSLLHANSLTRTSMPSPNP